MTSNHIWCKTGPVASVIIPTRNRCHTLSRCITLLLAQKAPLEVIVVDDGSTDETQQVIESQFSWVKYLRVEGVKGPSFARNKGAEIASAKILVCIDDDSFLESSETILQTLREFNHPRIGAVAIPFVKVRRGPEVHQKAPQYCDVIYITDVFVGAAHALRKDVFDKIGGYKADLFYMGEERDYCIRMLDKGYVVRVGNADPIYHQESAQRTTQLMDYYGRRNDVFYVWDNVPRRYVIIHLCGTFWNGVIAIRRSPANPFCMIRGMVDGIAGGFLRWNQRNPVKCSVYRLNRMLKKRKYYIMNEQELDNLVSIEDSSDQACMGAAL